MNLGIAKACDTILWTSIEEEFEQRGMPLRSGVRFGDCTAGGSCPSAREMPLLPSHCSPIRGFHKALPHPPAVYAAVLEGLLSKVEAHLETTQTPAGSPTISEDSAAEVENYKNSAEPFRTDDVFAVNFADDAYVTARGVREAEHTTGVIRQEHGKASHDLHATSSRLYPASMAPNCLCCPTWICRHTRLVLMLSVLALKLQQTTSMGRGKIFRLFSICLFLALLSRSATLPKLHCKPDDARLGLPTQNVEDCWCRDTLQPRAGSCFLKPRFCLACFAMSLGLTNTQRSTLNAAQRAMI